MAPLYGLTSRPRCADQFSCPSPAAPNMRAPVVSKLVDVITTNMH